MEITSVLEYRQNTLGLNTINQPPRDYLKDLKQLQKY